MRITGGEWGGRTLRAPKGSAIRPTQDRVKEALFSMLGAELPGARFLDLFAGAGSVGLDALSRGAACAVFVERDRRHAAAIKANAALLRAGDRCEIVCADAFSWVSREGHSRGFSIVFADPPYATAAECGFAGVMKAAAESGALRPGGLFIAESAAAQAAEEAPGWELLRDRVYGQSRIAVYRLAAGAVNGS